MRVTNEAKNGLICEVSFLDLMPAWLIPFDGARMDEEAGVESFAVELSTDLSTERECCCQYRLYSGGELEGNFFGFSDSSKEVNQTTLLSFLSSDACTTNNRIQAISSTENCGICKHNLERGERSHEPGSKL